MNWWLMDPTFNVTGKPEILLVAAVIVKLLIMITVGFILFATIIFGVIIMYKLYKKPAPHLASHAYMVKGRRKIS